jgi:ketosteroid isomerase-like protein
MPHFVISAFVLLVAASCLAQQPKLSPEQKQVWSTEEKYWQILTAFDREGYIALWDENTVAWPYPLPNPIRKNVIRSDPFGLWKGAEVKDVHLEPKAVQVFADVAVVYYIVTDTYTKRDGSSEVESIRITHTWRKTNGTSAVRIAGPYELEAEGCPRRRRDPQRCLGHHRFGRSRYSLGKSGDRRRKGYHQRRDPSCHRSY